jgi:hypothetical protein
MLVIGGERAVTRLASSGSGSVNPALTVVPSARNDPTAERIPPTRLRKFGNSAKPDACTGLSSHKTKLASGWR